MTLMATFNPTALPEARSLYGEARIRFFRNRAAVGSLLVLALVALASIFGPMLTGHSYDRVYRDYVRQPPSLEAHPTAAAIEGELRRLAARMRVNVASHEMAGETVRLRLVARGPIDERLLAFIERSDLFGPSTVMAREDEGRALLVNAPVERRHFLLGTDAIGRDLLTRSLHAGRTSLLIGLLASAVALLIGVSYGAIAGTLGGRIDAVMMRFVDILYALPFIFFVILLVVFFGRNFVLMFIAVGCIEWLDMARIVRGQTLSVRRQDYVQAAEALGVPTLGIVRRHIVPNVIGPVVVYVTLLVPKVILLESFLSFLGLGVQEPMTSLGMLIADGAKSIQGSTYMLVAPAALLVTMLFALNFIGDGLRDALDPKER